MTLLAYGVYIPWLGLYGDDWVYLWNYHQFGAQGFVPFVALDRPYSAWVYVLSTALIGEHVWAYHLLGLLVRSLSVLALWWVLKLIWPGQPRQVLAVALLFALYPGFKQQAIPIEFILHFTVLGSFLVSLALMVLAARGATSGTRPGRTLFLVLVSLLFSASMFSIEYFVGLELIRPAILWMVLHDRQPAPSRRLRLVLAYWWPYLLLLASFSVWRIFIYKFQFYQPVLLNALQANPVQGFLNLAGRVLNDIILVTLGAWRQVFEFGGGPRTLLIYLAVVITSLVTVGWLVIRYSSGSRLQGEGRLPTRLPWAAQAGLLGLFSLVVAGIPFWVTGISVYLTFPWDRATLPFMLGASLVLASLLEILLPPRFGRLVLIGLVALSIGFFTKTARTFINNWSEQGQFIWQLVWRAPELKPGTLLVTQNTSLDYIYDNGLTALVNWTYAPGLVSNQIPYNVFDLDLRKNTPYDIDLSTNGVPVEHTRWTKTFTGSTSAMFLFTYNSPSCLRILRPDDASSLVIPPALKQMKGLSRLSRISTSSSGAARPPLVLQPEPRHTWCYYFEKADLARQVEDWGQIGALWETASSQSFTPFDSSEYEPFIEAFAHLKNWDIALELSQKAGSNPMEKAGLCALWRNLEQDMAQNDPDLRRIKEIEQTLGCPTS